LSRKLQLKIRNIFFEETLSGLKSKQLHCDSILLVTTTVLVLIGLVMVFSSSGVYAMEKYNDAYYFLKRQIIWVFLGTIIMMLARETDYRGLEKYTYLIMGVTFLMLLAVMMPGLGKEVGGARRWLMLGGLTFQPSELAKFALILFIAKSLVKRSDQLKNFAYGYLPKLIVLGFFFIPILFQPDFGTAMIICIVTFTMLMIAGLRSKFLIYSILAIVPFAVLAIMNADYRQRRIIAFLNPWEHESNAGFQVVQSFYAFGRGGIFGSGIGSSSQKLFYLPEAHTDFIFSVIGEELGFVGALIIISLFSILIWRGFVIAYYAKDSFGTHVAIGLTLLIGIQAFMNIGVTVGLLPTKGLTLPFVSMGGSSLVILMLSIGVLLNISGRMIQN
jgi:cell division protein FtsW